MLETGLAKIYPYTKFKVSSFTYSRFMEGGLKFKNLAPELSSVVGAFTLHHQPSGMRPSCLTPFRAGLKTGLFNQAYEATTSSENIFVLSVYCTYLFTYLLRSGS